MNVYEDKCLREKVNHIIAAQKEGEIIIAAYKDGCGLTERANRGKQKTRVRNTLVFFSSGERIRTTDLRVMSQNPESVPFVRRALQISRPDELWSTLAGHAAVANRYSYSICFTWVRQVLFLAFLHSSFQFNLFKSIFSWGMRPP